MAAERVIGYFLYHLLDKETSAVEHAYHGEEFSSQYSGLLNLV